MPFVKLAEASELPEERMIVKSHGGRDVLLARVEGRVYALDNVCTHQGAPLHEGVLGGPDGDDPYMVTCPWHQAHFDLRTGQVHQECPWATDAPSFGVELRDDGVYVDLPA